MYRASKCVRANYYCISACPNAAIEIDESANPSLLLDRNLCDRCDTMACVDACMSEALTVAGRYFAVDELMRILRRDQSFWGDEGGVTFTGGEPLMQSEFLLTILKKCRSEYMHTTIETCAHVPTAVLLKVLQWTDWIFIDIKHMNSSAHKDETGVGNELVLENITAAAHAEWEGRLIIRIPIIPRYNDSTENLRATAEFMKGVHLNEVNLLPFHRLGSSKYEQVGTEYKFANASPPAREAMMSAKQIFEDAGLQCYVDYEMPG